MKSKIASVLLLGLALPIQSFACKMPAAAYAKLLTDAALDNMLANGAEDEIVSKIRIRDGVVKVESRSNNRTVTREFKVSVNSDCTTVVE